MSRAGRIYDTTPWCVECGRFKTRSDGPWMQHPTEYGWWCGCEPITADAHVVHTDVHTDTPGGK